MAVIDLVVPKLGLTMAEATVAEWLVSPGAAFAAGDPIVVIETDKIASEVEAPADGILVDIVAESGATLPVGALLGRWSGETGARAAGARETEATAGSPPSPVEPARSPVPDRPPGERVIASPYAHRLAREHGLDIREVGRVPGAPRIQAAHVLAHATLRAPASSSPIAFQTEVPRAPVAALRARLIEQLGGDLPWLAFVAAAAARALGEVPEAIPEAGDGVRLALSEDPDGEGGVVLPGADRLSLRAFAGAVARGGGDGGTAALLVGAPAADGVIRVGMSPAAPHAMTLSSTLGTEALTLVLSIDPSRVPLRAARRLLARIADRLAEPILLLT